MPHSVSTPIVHRASIWYRADPSAEAAAPSRGDAEARGAPLATNLKRWAPP
jgi:hypothetical protein